MALTLSIASILISFLLVISNFDRRPKSLREAERKIDDLSDRINDLEESKKDFEELKKDLEEQLDYSTGLRCSDWSPRFSGKFNRWNALIKYLKLEWQEETKKGFIKKYKI